MGVKMHDDRFIELVKALRNARTYRDNLLKEKNILDEKIKETSEYKAYSKVADTHKKYADKVLELEQQLRKELEDYPDYEPPVKAAWLVKTTNVILDNEKALAWARKYMPVAIIETLDEKLIKDWVKANPEYGKEIGKIEEKKVAKIAKDLTKFSL
jgi:hypothetical protein